MDEGRTVPTCQVIGCAPTRKSGLVLFCHGNLLLAGRTQPPAGALFPCVTSPQAAVGSIDPLAALRITEVSKSVTSSYRNYPLAATPIKEGICNEIA